MTHSLNNIQKIFLVSVLLLAILVPTHKIFADTLGKYTPLTNLPGIGKTEANNLSLYVPAMFKLIIGLAAVLAVIMIAIGGIEYMSTDAIGHKEDGKEKINHALMGLLLAIGAWLILYTVNPDTLKFEFSPDPLPQPAPLPADFDEINSDAYQNQFNWYRVEICYEGPPYHERFSVQEIFPAGTAYEDCMASLPEKLSSPRTDKCPFGIKTTCTKNPDAAY